MPALVFENRYMTLLVCRQSGYIIVRIVAVKTLVQLVLARITTTWLYTTVASVLMHMVLVVAHNLLTVWADPLVVMLITEQRGIRHDHT